MNPNITKIIDQYLSGELSSEEKLAFEEKMNSNAELKQEVELQLSIQEAAKRASLRTTVQKTGKKYHFTKFLKWIIAGFTVLVLATAIGLILKYGLFNGSSKIESISTELLKELDANAPIDALEAQYFSIAEDGEVVFTRNGVLVSVPKNAFLLNGKPFTGNVLVQVQEAMSGSEIVKAGLSTMSGDRMLETQGMFGVQGFTTEGKPLTLNPKVGVYMQVPVDENKAGMQLFEGIKGTDGNIDWQNPKPLAKLPVLASMDELDFYPEEYEAELNKLKWKQGRKERDSLYLSFEDLASGGRNNESVNAVGTVPQRKMTVAESKYVYGENRSIDRSMTESEALILSKSPICPDDLRNFKRDTLHSNQDESFQVKINSMSWIGIDNYEIHRFSELLESQLVYPEIAKSRKLEDVVNVELKCSKNEKESFVFKAGNSIFNQQKDLIHETLLSFIDKVKYKGFGFIQLTIEYKINETSRASVSKDAIQSTYILPSSVLAFWKPKFNNTNLSTRDFEKRMRAIHGTCTNEVLERYTNQLNKGLSEIDAEVVKMGFPEFQAFADENIGKIDVNNEHLKLIQAFYAEGIEKLKASSKSDREKDRKRQEKWDKEMDASRTKEASRAEERANVSLMEEYNFNLENVKKQIGPSVGFTLNHGGGTIVNIDKYVMEATVARTSTTITDPYTGKTAEIIYNDFKFKVAGSNKYIKLFAYLFPHELNSYQRIEGEDGNFEYPLNNDIIYDIAVVGLTESGYEFYQKQSFKSGDLGTIQMTKISEQKMDESIQQLNNTRYQAKPMNIKDELQWLKKEQADYVEQKQRNNMLQFRENMASIIFPCYCGATEGDYGSSIEEIMPDSTGFFN